MEFFRDFNLKISRIKLCLSVKEFSGLKGRFWKDAFS